MKSAREWHLRISLFIEHTAEHIPVRSISLWHEVHLILTTLRWILLILLWNLRSYAIASLEQRGKPCIDILQGRGIHNLIERHYLLGSKIVCHINNSHVVRFTHKEVEGLIHAKSFLCHFLINIIKQICHHGCLLNSLFLLATECEGLEPHHSPKVSLRLLITGIVTTRLKEVIIENDLFTHHRRHGSCIAEHILNLQFCLFLI